MVALVLSMAPLLGLLMHTSTVYSPELERLSAQFAGAANALCATAFIGAEINPNTIKLMIRIRKIFFMVVLRDLNE